MATDKPIAVVCVGMAGSGKTTFMQRINAHLHQNKQPPYVVNLDPAVQSVPFSANIDIRDSVNYKEVMRQYKLGPNGGILTSLNLFATKVDQVINILEKRTTAVAPHEEGEQTPVPIKHIIVDTPGQIEVFVWSASGDILLGALASSFPTVIAYIIDTPRSASTSTFMSNMLYACSIMYKTRLPMILVLNKSDVKDPSFAKEWMTDFEAFQAALRAEEESGVPGGLADGEEVPENMQPGAGQGSGYLNSLLHSMSLVLDEFYKHLSVVGVSAVTGDGVDDFFVAVQTKGEEFEREYRPEMEKRRARREKQKAAEKEAEMGRMMDDMAVGESGSSSRRRRKEPETVSEAEDETDSEEEASKDDSAFTRRYQSAVRRDDDDDEDEGADMSFMKYLKTSNIGS